ncbi:MAG: hypothetical protein ACFCBW_08935 [Candidatus Competibacterales bacterium]
MDSLEETAVAGGAGSAVGECLAGAGARVPLQHLGLPDRFIDQGERGELLREAGLDVAGVLKALAAGTVNSSAPPASD